MLSDPSFEVVGTFLCLCFGVLNYVGIFASGVFLLVPGLSTLLPPILAGVRRGTARRGVFCGDADPFPGPPLDPKLY